jgi:hypothetical protein
VTGLPTPERASGFADIVGSDGRDGLMAMKGLSVNVRNLGAMSFMGLAIAACGGGSGTSNRSVDPRDIVLTAAHVAESTSFRADLSAEMRFNVSGSQAGLFRSLAGQAIFYNGHLSEQNQRRNNLSLDISVNSRTISTRATVYDGALFVSSDGGSSYKTVPTNGLPQSQYGPQSALQYLETVGSVRDVGSGTADGLAVEKFSGQLDYGAPISVERPTNITGSLNLP